MPALALLSAMISLSIGTSFAKTLFAEIGAAGTTTYRIGIGALILLAWQRPWRWRLSRSALGKIFLYAVALGGMNLTFYFSLRTLPIGIAIAIELTCPLLLSVWLSRKVIDYVWIGLSVFGLYLLLPVQALDDRLDPAGVCFALAGGLFWTLYILFGKRLGGLVPGQATSVGLLMAALLVLPFGIYEAGSALLDPRLLVAGLGIGVLSSAVPYSLEMVALKGLPAKTFGMMLTMEPVIGAVAASLILKEHLTLTQWLAILSLMIASAGSAATAAQSSQNAAVGHPPLATHATVIQSDTHTRITRPEEIPAMQTTITQAFAPTGVLRASINLGNPVLANLDAQGKPVGISIDLAHQLGKRLGVPVELIVNDTAGKSVATLESGRADIGFFAVDPERGKEISFTEAYVLIEGFYLVREHSPIFSNAQVDATPHRVVVGKGSAYDLFLTRNLTLAEIVRAPSSQVVVQTFLEQGIDVAAGVKQQLEADTRDVQGVRMLDERFMVIRQAMGVPKNRGPEAALFLRTFVEDMKAQGIVRDAMTRHGIQGAGIAPAANPNIDPLSIP